MKPKVDRLLQEFLKEATESGLPFQVTQGYRSFAEQTKLYNQVPKVTNAKAGESFHNYGLAFDIVLLDKNGKRTYNGDWEAVAHIAESIGLEWGGSWGNVGNMVTDTVYTGEGMLGFVDQPHFQYTAGHKITDFINNKVDMSLFN